MKKIVIGLLLLLVLVIVAILKSDKPEWFTNFIQEKDPSLYSVVSVSDGDTITVDMNGTNERIRMIGIDTPEKNHPELAVQCFANEAEQHLEDILGNSKVRLEADPENSNRDIYDRLLRFVHLPDGTNVNAQMVSDGYAFAYTGYSNSKIVDFQELEKQARENNLGLWNSCDVEVNNGRPQTNPSQIDN